MDENKKVIETSGKCLCGAVTFNAKSTNVSVGACHCDTCRTWGGGPFMGVDCGTDIVYEGKDSIEVFASSEWAERGFCKKCGTNLYYHLKQTGQHIVPAGALDGESQFVLDHQIFIDQKPEYYRFKGEKKMHNMTGADLFAMFAGEGS